MIPYWRITKILLLGLIIPGGVLAFGYLWLGPNMSLMPRLDKKGWELEISRNEPLAPQIEDEAEVTEEKQSIAHVTSKKANYRRRRRPTSQLISKGAPEVKPAEATAEVPPAEGSLTAN